MQNWTLIPLFPLRVVNYHCSLQGAPRRAEGKGVKRSERASAVANPSPQHKPTVCRMLFYAQKDAPKMHRPRFYTLLLVYSLTNTNLTTNFNLTFYTFVYLYIIS